MSVPELLAAVGALGILVRVGTLPRTFFRPGRRTLQWWLNAVPFWVAGTVVAAGGLGVLAPLDPGSPAARSLLPVASLATSLAAWLLLRAAVRAHARPLSLWHQPDDRPEHLVVRGPYARVRHPFYSAFLLALLAALLAVPHLLTAAALGWAAVRLRATAALEEARFLASPLAGEYAAYAARTGRFVPRPGRRAGAPSTGPHRGDLSAAGSADAAPGGPSPSSAATAAARPSERAARR